jgi:arylformamidase
MNALVYNGYTAEQLEAQYNARAAVPGHEKMFEKWRRQSADYRRQSRCELDIPYTSSERGILDIFLPEQTDAPVHLFIHGGYWRAMDKSDFSYLAKGLVNRGALVAIANYGRCPALSMDGIVEQMHSACAWLRRHCAEYGGKADSIHISGHSAGGHLTAMMMATDWPSLSPDLPPNLVKSGVAVSGLFDLEPLRYIPLNDDLRLDQKRARLNSPIFLKRLTHAPLSLVVGGEESDEFRRQSVDFFSQWGGREAGIEYFELPNLNHFTVIDQMKSPGNPLTETILRHMSLA